MRGVAAERQHRVRDAARRYRIREGPLRRRQGQRVHRLLQSRLRWPLHAQRAGGGRRPRAASLQRGSRRVRRRRRRVLLGVRVREQQLRAGRHRRARARASVVPARAPPKPTPIPVGGDCSAPLPGQGCATGAACLPSGSLGDVPGAGEGRRERRARRCYDCASPLFCALDAAGGTGTCQPAASTGAPCNTVVSFGACDDLRDYCDKTTAKCTRLGAVGASCDPAQQNCIGYASCLGGTCVAMSPERGACDTTNGPTCLGDLECSSQTSTCGFPDFVSAPCS